MDRPQKLGQVPEPSTAQVGAILCLIKFYSVLLIRHKNVKSYALQDSRTQTPQPIIPPDGLWFRCNGDWNRSFTKHLLVPSRPWLHVSMDSDNSLPVTQGNLIILVCVDHCSKACKFVPLSKLPSTKEMAELFLQHMHHQRFFQRCGVCGAGNLPADFGWPFVNYSGPLLVCPQMGRPRGYIKTWSVLFNVILGTTPHMGMPITPSGTWLLAYHFSSASLGTLLLYLWNRMSRLGSQQWSN